MTDDAIVAAADQVVADHWRQQTERGLSHAAAREATAAEFERRHGAGSLLAGVARYYRDCWDDDLRAGPDA